MSTFPADFDAALTKVYTSALESGELIFTPSEIFKSKETKFEVEFEISYAPSLAKKPHGILPVVESDPAPKVLAPSTPVIKQVEKVNPFLPHSPALYVTDIGEDHKILLNKFCVVDKHFLVVTKEFHRQTEPLTPEDLVAVWNSLKALKHSENALAYFNCGSRSGASQPHKHMQVLPLEVPSPITTLVRECTARRPGQKATSPGDLFSISLNCIHHAILLKTPETTGKSQEDILIDAYISLMDAMIMSIREYADDEAASVEDRNLAANMRSSFDYNWILTTEFMMIVPRRQESVISNGVTLDINSLGFAGMILAKTQEELELAQDRGVLEIASETGFWFGPTGKALKEEQERKKAEQVIAENQIGCAPSTL